MQKSLVKWLAVVGMGIFIAVLPPPEGVTRQSWLLLAIFIATIVGSMLQPIAASAIVLLGVAATVVTGALDPAKALKGYSDPVVWLVLAAFFLSCGMVKTGLGRRIALLLIRAIGKRSLGLGYALVASDFVLASMIPSNGARSGGIILPVACSIAETYDSRPDDGTAGRLGAYLMNLLYQGDVIICATFITGQAANLIVAKLVAENTPVRLGYLNWLAAAIVPGLVSLIVVPLVIYRFFPPEIKETPEAAELAARELRKMGKFSTAEKIMLGTLIAVVVMWAGKEHFHTIDTSVIALLGVCLLLLTRVVDWKDLMGERNAWSVFIWYGGLVNMATELGNTGLTKLFADKMAGLTDGMTWAAALTVLLLIYFYSHYFFASITAHVLAMLVPFLAATIAVGAPVGLTVLFLIYFSNLNASLTHYGTTPGPIYFGTGYVKQSQWWTIGLTASVINIAIWSTIGLGWWKLLGWF
jgi:DASS family divalent anion:Na+ symporter